MINTWLRSNRYAAVGLAVLRIYLGWMFLNAGWEKITGPKAFTAAGFLANALKHPVAGTNGGAIYPTFNMFLRDVALPYVGGINVLVPWGELLVGVGLILGALTTTAMFFGLLMNFMYMFAGTVSTNPWDVLIGMFVLVGGYNAGVFGVDRWLIPWIRKSLSKLFKTELTLPTGKNGSVKG